MEQNTIFLFIVTSVSLTLFPGPDIMYVISTSLAKRWRKVFFLVLVFVLDNYSYTSCCLGLGVF